MAHPLVWPGRYYFYPIGNTPSVCLTRDMPPEEDAHILLLGCGDPRNVLYTVYNEPSNSIRALDFTCCDIEPAILARNVLLLTMIADKELPQTVIWDTFFHFHLDKNSLSALTVQCQKLIELSATLREWNESAYGQFVRMSTEYTLVELRRHWSLYVDMQHLPRPKLDELREGFRKMSKSTLDKFSVNASSARSAGPLMLAAVETSSDLFRQFWKTGVTYTDPKKISAATSLNPTFFHSLAGQNCSIHYGIDPMVPFHLAEVYGNTRRKPSAADVVKAAKAEFEKWCSAFAALLSPTSSKRVVVRMICGDCMAICQALRTFAFTESLSPNIPVAQWKAQVIHLEKEEYISKRAPALFNVIDTSNLIDHIGLLNILIAAVPILSPSTPSSVLYTESLLFRGEDATKEFMELLYADLTAIGLLFGVCPIDYLSGFTSRSNSHELMLHMATKRKSNQFHQVTTWKAPVSGDALLARSGRHAASPSCDSLQLGTFLYDMYHEIFQQEDAMNFWRLNQGNLTRAFASSNILHYSRESFVLLLKLVRDRLRIPEENWLEVMDRFFDLQDADQSAPMDRNNMQEFCAQLHRHSVYTAPHMKPTPPKTGIFSSWDSVPTLVRIILIVPREKLSILEESAEQIGTPILNCDIRGKWSHNIYSSVHVAYGTVIRMGTGSGTWAVFTEDSAGARGSSSLVASFTMSSCLLTDIEPMENFLIRLSVRSTPASAVLVSKLGLELTLFHARLMDQSAVIVLPERPLPTRALLHREPADDSHLQVQIGPCTNLQVTFDEQCELVTSLTSRISVDDEEVRKSFKNGATPSIIQLSPCTMRLGIGKGIQDVAFPFPVIGSQNKLRLARTSMYVEVVVPPYSPLKPDGMKLNPWPVTVSRGILGLYSIHRLNLARMPVLDIKAFKLDQWLNSHLGSQMSSRERSLRKKHEEDTLMYIKDSLHSIFVRSAGIQGGPAGRLFALRDNATNNCDTVLFVSDLRYDLHCHTVICDAFVLPLTHDLLFTIEKSFAKLVHEGQMNNITVYGNEMAAWKQLLPVLVERCRLSWTHGTNCEYKSEGRIPRCEDMEKNPLCTCGQGQDTEPMKRNKLWSPVAPYVTRVALSPLFVVSYLETIGRDPAAHKCFVCRGKGKPKLLACTGCLKVRYCSRDCQKKHWKVHKLQCKR
ncbi:uncharacterized protein LAESUDRAFT_744706 [Laetiporus sulphureus 93-53]|uniref:MYND-type domain-containing protein n=1 Tax=Laetiporus sulphureus 93-53 TaxID=1314785 RepID=A0A165CP88_9APHY|nr:uncharacterized protein LAESUDRAFT_744706 [Laetiporus sulphureus 93-53]KZT03168.1 hypothetical protein LAESUDRAFT_744706 [Laetiporus sulphureus 93-53]